jgi:DNA excision repair protein ERCC-3
LEKLSKYELPENVKQFIFQWTKSYGKIKLVLQNNKFYIESQQKEILQELKEDSLISTFSNSFEIKQQEIYDLNTNSVSIWIK